MTRRLKTVRPNQQSRHFGITAGQGGAMAAGHAVMAYRTARREQASPEAPPPSPYRGVGSHIEAGFEKVGPDFARNVLRASNGVGGW
jgi:hypothetical protein